MDIRNIEVNTSRLKTDVDHVSELISSIESKLNEMKIAVTELNTMWEGSAKEKFRNAFDTDQKMASIVIKEFKSIHDYEENAQKTYDQCEKTIAEIISEITI